MNIFEDLVEELKEANLLEETVTKTNLPTENKSRIQVSSVPPKPEFIQNFEEPVFPEVVFKNNSSASVFPFGKTPETPEIFQVKTDPNISVKPADLSVTDLYKTTKLSESDLPVTGDFGSFVENRFGEVETVIAPISIKPENEFENVSEIEFIQSSPYISKIETQTVENSSVNPIPESDLLSLQTPALENFEASDEVVSVADTSSLHFDIYETADTEMDYYRRRAIEEVTSLQVVEHIFAGVEREQMKTQSVPFDDIAVKKALHDFLQFLKENPDNDTEIARAEFNLMQETEEWCLALSFRDKQISVIDLRRYCETTRPALSPQALQGLARFYRNLPHNESIRAKFEMVLTRLFTTGDDRNRRELILEREAIIEEISQLYAEWASVPVYSDSEETELLLINLKFNDFINEAEAATKFEELVKSGFYDRLRDFKEEIGDKFYAPQVLASAVECNVCVGNRFIDLINKESANSSPEALQVKYGFALEKSASEAAGKTINLTEVLISKKEKFPKRIEQPTETLKVTKSSDERKNTAKTVGLQKQSAGLFGISRWVLVLLIGTILLTVGLYAFVEFGGPKIENKDVQTVNLETSSFKEYLVSAKINQELLIGITKENWATLEENKKQEILAKLLSIGKEKGYKKVHLLNHEGITVSYANDKEIVGNALAKK